MKQTRLQSSHCATGIHHPKQVIVIYTLHDEHEVMLLRYPLVTAGTFLVIPSVCLLQASYLSLGCHYPLGGGGFISRRVFYIESENIADKLPFFFKFFFFFF